MKDAIPPRLAAAQPWTLAVALPLCLAAPFAPSLLARIAGAALALAFLLLAAALWSAWRTFLRHDRALR